MKELKLGVWDRIILTNLLFSGSDGSGMASLKDQRTIFNLLDAGIEISKEETKKINLRQEDNITLWNNSAKDKVVNLEDEDFVFLKNLVYTRKLPVDRRVTKLKEKINI